jgi:hypothetical protein
MRTRAALGNRDMAADAALGRERGKAAGGRPLQQHVGFEAPPTSFVLTRSAPRRLMV